MKIVCDACSAKYSIADEKVKGKVFKIRCKKCSNIIVVRGNAGAAAEEPAPAGQFDQKETRVYDYGGDQGGEAPPGGDDAVWHVVIDQEQVGPITVAEVSQKFAAGEIDAESYIWREGFADWLPLAQVPDFAALAAGGGATSQGSSGADAVSSMFGSTNFDDGGTSRSDPNDVFAAHAAKAAAEDQDEGADELFGQSSKKSKSADAGFGAGKAASPAVAASPSSLKGQRSENSVLFSLNNLAALASDSPKAAPVAAASSSSSGAAQHGGGEGSGLIDIRSMASAYLGAAKSGGAAPAAGGPKVGSIDDLPVFSTAAFSEPAVIIPTVGAGRRDNKLMYALLGAVALLAIVLVIVVVVLVTGDKKGSGDNQVAMGGAGGSDSATGKGTNDVLAGSATEPGTGSASASGEEPGTGSAAATGAGDGSGSAEDSGSGTASAKPPEDRGSSSSSRSGSSSSSRSGSSSSSSRSGSSSDRGGSSGSSKPSGGTTAASSDSGGKCLDEVACLLADKPPACCSKYRGGGGGGGGTKPSGGGSSGGGSSNLPEDLQKAHISAGISKVRGRVEGCAAKSSAKGTVKVSVKVAGNGTVSSVTVKEKPDAALGSCVAAAVEKATFAKTQNGGSFSYPFTFR